MSGIRSQRVLSSVGKSTKASNIEMHAFDEPMHRQTPQKHDSKYNQQLVPTNDELSNNPGVIKKHASGRLEHAVNHSEYLTCGAAVWRGCVAVQRHSLY